MIHVRCFSCNKVIASRYPIYLELLEQGCSKKDALDKIGMKRMCCRRMILGHVSTIDKITNTSLDHKNMRPIKSITREYKGL